MKETSLALIRTVLDGDNTVTKEQNDHIMRTCKHPIMRRKLINAKQAMSILEVCRPTLLAYVKRGRLTQINISPRKVRFDEAEVRNLAYRGVTD
ncbi:MAG: hypothetical protein J5944_08180 [Lentisphaeria bacterium]|nr:hypothetical protein [Lentisphaeria bacterium]